MAGSILDSARKSSEPLEQPTSNPEPIGQIATIHNPGERQMALPSRKHTPSVKGNPSNKKKGVKKNPTAPKGLSDNDKKQYLAYKKEFSSSRWTKPTLQAYLDRNRGSKTLRYRAARAVMASFKRKAAPKKPKAKTKAVSRQMALPLKKAKPKAKKKTTKAKGSGSMAEKIPRKVKGRYDWSDWTGPQLFAYVKKCISNSRCSTPAYKSARTKLAAMGGFKTKLKNLGSVGKTSHKSGKTKAKKKTTTKKKAAAKRKPAKKKTAAKKKTYRKAVNVSGMSNKDLINDMVKATGAGRTYTLKYKAMQKEVKKRAAAGVIPPSFMNIMNAKLAQVGVTAPKVKAKTKKAYKKAIAKKKPKRAAKAPRVVRYKFYVNGEWQISSIAQSLTDLYNRLASNKNKTGARKKILTIHTVAREAAQRSGNRTLLSMIANINNTFGKTYSLEKLPDSLVIKNPRYSSLYGNPSSNPALPVLSVGGFALFGAGHGLSRIVRGVTDAVLESAEKKNPQNYWRPRYGMLLKLLSSGVTSGGLLLGGYMADRSNPNSTTSGVLYSMGAGSLSDTVFYGIQILASVMSKNAARYVGGPTANIMDLKEPVKLFPVVPAVGTSTTPDAAKKDAGAPLKGYLPSDAAEQIASQSYWQGVQTSGYQPAGLLNGYRQDSIQSVQGYRDASLGKAMTLVGTSRRRRMMTGFLG